MLRKDTDPDWDSRTKDDLEGFEALKRKLVAPPILGLPKANRPYMIDTDASAYQLGSDVVTATKRNGAERMDADWILVEDANGLRRELLDDGT